MMLAGIIEGLVSIHAPAWGATGKLYLLDEIVLVSIHAPAWGATYPGRAVGSSNASFNPRPRMGGDK